MDRVASKILLGLAALGIICATLGVPEVKAQALRVCADPDYLPFSNQAGQGLENKLADVAAKALGEKLEYTWASYRGPGGFDGFLYQTLNAKKCDVVMQIPYGYAQVLSTNPYYVSSYVFVYKKSRDYDIHSMDSPILRKLKIGFESETPPEMGLKLRGLVQTATPFEIGERAGESPSVMLAQVQSGALDVVITWEPAIGYFLPKYPDLEVVAVPNERALGAPEQYAFPVAMGVRNGDESLKKRLDGAISTHQDQIAAILAEYGVKLYKPNVPGLGSY
jgi:mxaJ protein